MLQKIRDNSQSIGAKIFVWFIVVIFGAWGASSIVTSVITTNPTVTVNGEEIDELEVEQSAQRRIQELITSLGPDADLSDIDEDLIRDAAINELIQRELMLQYAEQTGMVVSSRSIDRSIAQTADFQIDGVFNGERAQILLQSMGYTPNSYRAALASEGVMNQISFAYGLSGFITRPEMETLAKLLNQTRDLRYLLISMDGLLGSMDISDEEIAEYYTANENQFMLEEQVSLDYLELDKEAIFDEVTVTEEQIRQRYDEQQVEYQSLIERRASHILLEAFSEEDYAEVMNLAEELKERIDASESFEDLAGEYSNDLGSAEFGGDVGYTSGENFVEEFEQALLALDVDEVSAPVRTEFGVHLIKLTERSESEIESYEDSAESLERDLKTAEVDRIFLERAEELGNLAFESFDLADPADIMGLEIQTTSLFGRRGGVGIATNGDVINSAFTPELLIDGLNSDLIAITPARSVAIRVVDHNQPQLQPLDVVSGEIQILLQFEKIRERAVDLGETIRDSMQNGQNIDTLLETQDLNWNQLNALERSNQLLPPELVQNVFDMPGPEAGDVRVDGFQLSTGEYVVVELQNVNEGSLEDLEQEEQASLQTFLAQQYSNEEFEALILGLQNRADINR
ncbi:MAG: SurA N-terminal domain-containing protein [Gammaproteobacteria bacterium]|nr:SurA N-terminal domain-containing protein [Gammaproteobacteria bacterium]